MTGGTPEFRGGLGETMNGFIIDTMIFLAPALGQMVGNGHSADEYVELDSLVETAKVVALTALDWYGIADDEKR